MSAVYRVHGYGLGDIAPYEGDVFPVRPNLADLVADLGAAAERGCDWVYIEEQQPDGSWKWIAFDGGSGDYPDVNDWLRDHGVNRAVRTATGKWTCLRCDHVWPDNDARPHGGIACPADEPPSTAKDPT